MSGGAYHVTSTRDSTVQTRSDSSINASTGWQEEAGSSPGSLNQTRMVIFILTLIWVQV